MGMSYNEEIAVTKEWDESAGARTMAIIQAIMGTGEGLSQWGFIFLSFSALQTIMLCLILWRLW